MTAAVAIGIGVLILAAMAYDIARLIKPAESRYPPLARLRGRRAALEHAERWCVGLRLHDRIDTATYQHWMNSLAHGRRQPADRRPPTEQPRGGRAG